MPILMNMEPLGCNEDSDKTARMNLCLAHMSDGILSYVGLIWFCCVLSVLASRLRNYQFPKDISSNVHVVYKGP